MRQSRKLFGLHRPRGFESPSLRTFIRVKTTYNNCDNVIIVSSFITFIGGNMGAISIERANSQLSHVQIRSKKGRLSLRGTFPTTEGKKRKEFGLGCSDTPEGIKIALAKAKEIDSQLLLGTWQQEEKKKLTVTEAITLYEKDYWAKNEKTDDRAYNWKKNQYVYWGYLPQDEVFDKHLIKKALESFDGGSYKQKKMAQLISPIARFHDIAFDFTPYKKYKQTSLKFEDLPTDEKIIECCNRMAVNYHKVALLLMAFYGLRPHELFRSKIDDKLFDRNIDFEEEPIKVYVNEKTKTKARTVFPIAMNTNFELLQLIRENLEKENDLCNYFAQYVKINNTNRELGAKVSRWFSCFDFSPYQLRHYYAVRGAMCGISPVVVASWMGHSLSVHYKHYASLIGDRESEQLWKNTFK